MKFIYNNWSACILMYLLCSVTWTQVFNKIAKKTKNDAASTVLFEWFGGAAGLVLSLLLPYKWPSSSSVILCTVLAVIFYAIVDRFNIKALAGIQSSAFSILNQITTAFMIFAGILFFKEPLLWGKMLGAVLILAANVYLFYEKGAFAFNKYIGFGLVAACSVTVATFLDVNISESYNLFFYIFLCLGVPGTINFFVSRTKFRELKEEMDNVKAGWLILNGVSMAGMILFLLRAYQLGDASLTAPLCASSVVLNVIAAYVIAKEKDHLIKKIFCAGVILASILLITFA